MTPFAKLMNDRQAKGLCRQCGKDRQEDQRLCDKCHRRLLDQLNERRKVRAKKGICKNTSCKCEVYKQGYCHKHYLIQLEVHRKSNLRYYYKKKEKR